MKSKKSILIILSILFIVSLVVFSSCGKDDTDAIPTNADPAPTQEPTETPAPTPEQDERMHFDDFVAQYESFNDIDLNTSDDSIQEDFFEEIYMQNYTKTDALEDKAEVSKDNAALLDKYLTFLDNFQHEECGFDIAVNEFMLQYSNGSFTEEQKNEMYMSLAAQFITPEDIDQWDCDNEYAQGYIEWYNDKYRGDGPVQSQVHIATEEEWEQAMRESQEAAARVDEETRRDLAEADQWAQEHLDEIGHDM